MRIIKENKNPNCSAPNCNGKAIKKGFTTGGVQQYQCKKCNRRFKDDIDTPKATVRHQRIHEFLAKGFGVREISQKTGYATGTISGYLKNMSDITKIYKKDEELDKELEQQGFSKKEERMNVRLNIWLSVLRNTRWPPDVRDKNIIARYERRIKIEILVKKLAKRSNNREVELKALVHLQKNSYHIRNLLEDYNEKNLYRQAYKDYHLYLSYTEGSKNQTESLKMLQEKTNNEAFQEPSQNFINLWKCILETANKSEADIPALAKKRYYREFIRIEMEKDCPSKNFWKRYQKLMRKYRKMTRQSILDSDKVKVKQLANDYEAKLNTINPNLSALDPQRLAVVAQAFAAFADGVNASDKTPTQEIQQIENKIERAMERIEKLLKY